MKILIIYKFCAIIICAATSGKLTEVWKIIMISFEKFLTSFEILPDAYPKSVTDHGPHFEWIICIVIWCKYFRLMFNFFLNTFIQFFWSPSLSWFFMDQLNYVTPIIKSTACLTESRVYQTIKGNFADQFDYFFSRKIKKYFRGSQYFLFYSIRMRQNK